MLRESLPHGFRTASKATGLIVPVETDREREVWTRDEWKLVDRVTKLLAARGIKFQFGCTDPRCQGERMEFLPQIRGRAEPILRCNHRDRVWSRSH